jgi:DNA topoisomerase-1
MAENQKKIKKLRYVTDAQPGIRRKKKGKSFSYLSPDGEEIISQEIISRIKSLSIPPAYTDVWICPHSNGHIQATGRDSRNRKQYRYHPDWTKFQNTNKFQRVYLFGKTLPDIRKKVSYDLRKIDLSRKSVLAALVRIMDKSYVRVGNRGYAKAHKTFGITTLRKKHVCVIENETTLKFAGKNKTPWNIQLQDPKIAQVVRKCTEIQGYELFKYMDDRGIPHTLRSEDFNTYLKEVSGHDFTAKDFRTWAACKEAFALLCNQACSENLSERKKKIKEVVRSVASLMGHTEAICKKSYIHPKLLKSWEEGLLQKWVSGKKIPNKEKLFLKWWKAHIKEGSVG